jgi:hypothetical protein
MLDARVIQRILNHNREHSFLESNGILRGGGQHLPGPTLPDCSIPAICWRFGGVGVLPAPSACARKDEAVCSWSASLRRAICSAAT